METLSRYQGALFGLAVGDALGTTLEFKPRDTFEPITDIVGGGPFGLQPGQWTDDTSMALCLAESLVTCQGFDAADQMQRYVRWYREGYWSSTGTLFDIGSTVSAALRRFERDGNPFAGETHARAGGNGSLMRLVPIPLAFANDPTEAMRLAGEMSRTTHAAPEPVDACRYYAGLVLGAKKRRRSNAPAGGGGLLGGGRSALHRTFVRLAGAVPSVPPNPHKTETVSPSCTNINLATSSCVN